MTGFIHHFILCLLAGMFCSFIRTDSSQEVDPFSLEIVKYNHASESTQGRLYYHITQDSVVVDRSFKDVLFAFDVEWNKDMEFNFAGKASDPIASQAISGTDSNSLKDKYYNDHVPPTSGDEIYIKFRKGSTERKIWIHSARAPEIDSLFSQVNKLVPEAFKL